MFKALLCSTWGNCPAWPPSAPCGWPSLTWWGSSVLQPQWYLPRGAGGDAGGWHGVQCSAFLEQFLAQERIIESFQDIFGICRWGLGGCWGFSTMVRGRRARRSKKNNLRKVGYALQYNYTDINNNNPSWVAQNRFISSLCKIWFSENTTGVGTCVKLRGDIFSSSSLASVRRCISVCWIWLWI